MAPFGLRPTRPKTCHPIQHPPTIKWFEAGLCRTGRAAYGERSTRVSVAFSGNSRISGHFNIACLSTQGFTQTHVQVRMAGISGPETSGGKRKLDHDLPLVPFIDFMVCLVAFLMVTAVWMNMGRLEATARAPGEGETPSEPPNELHVIALSDAFQLDW